MINILPKKISDKIAAGEIIERPVSIIKELVENSIDAGASQITVEIKKGGKAYIRVTDDGSGIAPDEVETAFLRHATSKITKAEELNSIHSLGFRGEALASIAAVTRTSLITKVRSEQNGRRIVIHGGDVIENKPVGCPDGTTIVVTDLFYNVPARREFLKGDGAESAQITELVTELALCYTSVRFQLTNNGNIIFTTSGSGDNKATIKSLYRGHEYQNLIEVKPPGADGISLRGYISKPSITFNSRKAQIFFVNGRIVESKLLERGVSDGYRERMFSGRFPLAFLFIELDPVAVEVNIHPSKRQIRFHDDAKIREFIAESIRIALMSDVAVVSAFDNYKKFKKKFHEKSEEKSVENKGQVDLKHILSTKRVAEENVGYICPYSDGEESNPEHDDTRINGQSASKECEPIVNEYNFGNEAAKADIILSPDEPKLKPFDFSALNVTGIIFDTYISAVDGGGFYLIDQHAAQERIFYEKLVGEYMSDEKPSQVLLSPLTVNVTLAESEHDEMWLDLLRRMGYDIENFGPGVYIIRQIPYFMEISEAENFIKSFVAQLEDDSDLRNRVIVDKLITKSCKQSIKANDRISLEEAEALITDLTSCNNPFSCPHGRPTFIRFSKYDIEHMFKRA